MKKSLKIMLVSALALVMVFALAACGEDPYKATAVTLDKTTAEVTVGETVTLTANAGVVWTSSDESVATVADGVVTGVKAGAATITATLVDEKGIAGAKVVTEASCEVTVKKAPVEPESTVELKKGSEAVSGPIALANIGDSVELTYEVKLNKDDKAAAGTVVGIKDLVSNDYVDIVVTPEANDANKGTIKATAKAQGYAAVSVASKATYKFSMGTFTQDVSYASASFTVLVNNQWKADYAGTWKATAAQNSKLDWYGCDTGMSTHTMASGLVKRDDGVLVKANVYTATGKALTAGIVHGSIDVTIEADGKAKVVALNMKRKAYEQIKDAEGKVVGLVSGDPFNRNEQAATETDVALSPFAMTHFGTSGYVFVDNAGKATLVYGKGIVLGTITDSNKANGAWLTAEFKFGTGSPLNFGSSCHSDMNSTVAWVPAK